MSGNQQKDQTNRYKHQQNEKKQSGPDPILQPVGGQGSNAAGGRFQSIGESSRKVIQLHDFKEASVIEQQGLQVMCNVYFAYTTLTGLIIPKIGLRRWRSNNSRDSHKVAR